MNQVTFVEKVAGKIAQLGLTMPAILLIEAHKPIAFIGGQFLLVAQPTFNLFISPHLIQGMIELLTNPIQLEHLITYLERGAPSPSIEKPVVAITSNEEANL